MDIWGQIYIDQWRGDPHPHAFHRDDRKGISRLYELRHGT